MAQSIAELRARLGVTPAPSPGMGFALDPNGRIPAAVAKYLPGYTLSYQQIVTNKSVMQTTEATADTVVTADTITFDGATAVWIEFEAQRADRGTTNIQIALYDAVGAAAAASIGILGLATGAAPTGQPFRRAIRITPSAAAHTYSIRAWVDAGTGTVIANVGGVGANVPTFIRITRA